MKSLGVACCRRRLARGRHRDLPALRVPAPAPLLVRVLLLVLAAATRSCPPCCANHWHEQMSVMCRSCPAAAGLGCQCSGAVRSVRPMTPSPSARLPRPTGRPRVPNAGPAPCSVATRVDEAPRWAEARCRSQEWGKQDRQTWARRRARSSGCSRASAPELQGARSSWPRPATGQSRQWAAPLPPPMRLPHSLATHARAAHDLPSPPFDIQDISLPAAWPWALLWFA